MNIKIALSPYGGQNLKALSFIYEDTDHWFSAFNGVYTDDLLRLGHGHRFFYYL